MLPLVLISAEANYEKYSEYFPTLPVEGRQRSRNCIDCYALDRTLSSLRPAG